MLFYCVTGIDDYMALVVYIPLQFCSGQLFLPHALAEIQLRTNHGWIQVLIYSDKSLQILTDHFNQKTPSKSNQMMVNSSVNRKNLSNNIQTSNY